MTIPDKPRSPEQRYRITPLGLETVKKTADASVWPRSRDDEAGVRSCWIVQPVLKAIAVLEPGEKPRLYSSGEVRDPATDVSVRVEEIFKS